jgi:DNA primase
MNNRLSEIANRFNLRRRSGRWAGPCPKCQGSNTSDKFVMRDDGGFKCYGCDFKGDYITWLRTMEGMTCPEAHQATGKECRNITCAVYATCRAGDGNSRILEKGHSAAPIFQPKERTVGQALPRDPTAIWRSWAECLVRRCAADLQHNTAALAWLAARGIDADTAARFHLGWHQRDSKVDRAALELDPKGDKTILWIPGGLVIPTLDEQQHVYRLRIRRTDEARGRFLSDLKYVWIEGSGTAPLVITPISISRGVLIIEAELDAMACASAHQEVTVIALGTVRANITPAIAEQIAAAPVILAALDADTGDATKAGAGPEAVTSWLNTYRQARYWPVPLGKDPGDYVKDYGGRLFPWIECGLPSVETHALPQVTA